MNMVMLRKFTGLLVTIVMLFFGICFHDITTFDRISADSCFAYTEMQKNIPVLSSVGNILSENEMCADEQLSARGAGSQLEEGSQVNEKAVRRIKFLSLSEDLPNFSALKYYIEAAEKDGANIIGTVIINYVHNQDGAKSR